MGSNQGNTEITNLNLSTNVTISAYSRTGGFTKSLCHSDSLGPNYFFSSQKVSLAYKTNDGLSHLPPSSRFAQSILCFLVLGKSKLDAGTCSNFQLSEFNIHICACVYSCGPHILAYIREVDLRSNPSVINHLMGGLH